MDRCWLWEVSNSQIGRTRKVDNYDGWNSIVALLLMTFFFLQSLLFSYLVIIRLATFRCWSIKMDIMDLSIFGIGTRHSIWVANRRLLRCRLNELIAFVINDFQSRNTEVGSDSKQHHVIWCSNEQLQLSIHFNRTSLFIIVVKRLKNVVN